MKTRFKTLIGALALTFMLLFGAVAFGRTANASVGNPNMSASAAPSARNERWKNRRHRRYMRHETRREKRWMKRERKERR